MRTNGTISFELETLTETNDFGEVVAHDTQWSDPVPCFISVNTDNRKGRYEDGEFHMATYSILVCEKVFPQYGNVRLARGDESLGEYRIQSVTPIETFKRTRILV